MVETNAHITAEIGESSEAVRRQEQILHKPLSALVNRLERTPPRVVVTCARGSSAHAASFAKHSIERHTGIPVAPAAPSIATVYHRELALKDQLYLVISQSGQSDDLIEQTLSARAAGALTVALVNAEDSPLTQICDVVLPLCAGPERSIAATKTFIATLAAILRLTALWAGDGSLRNVLAELPDHLDAAARLDWSTAVPALSGATNLMTIGRGPSLAIAAEAALKLKETCRLHAEAFSGAEFLHGPVSLIDKGYPVLMFMPGDDAACALRELATDLRRKGAALFVARHGDPAEGILPMEASGHPETDAVCAIQSFYAMVVRLARQRGYDADRPQHLQKVTSTR